MRGIALIPLREPCFRLDHPDGPIGVSPSPVLGIVWAFSISTRVWQPGVTWLTIYDVVCTRFSLPKQVKATMEKHASHLM